jgi:hypothetical protein
LSLAVVSTRRTVGRSFRESGERIPRMSVAVGDHSRADIDETHVFGDA